MLPELRHSALNALMTGDIPDDHVISGCPGVGQQPDQSDQNDPVTTAESNSAQRVPAVPLRFLFLKGFPQLRVTHCPFGRGCKGCIWDGSHLGRVG